MVYLRTRRASNGEGSEYQAPLPRQQTNDGACSIHPLHLDPMRYSAQYLLRQWSFPRGNVSSRYHPDHPVKRTTHPSGRWARIYFVNELARSSHGRVYRFISRLERGLCRLLNCRRWRLMDQRMSLWMFSGYLNLPMILPARRVVRVEVLLVRTRPLRISRNRKHLDLHYLIILSILA